MAEAFALGRANGTPFYRAGSGPVLVFIHGVGMHAGVWAPQLAAFAGEWDVIAYDTLGHGGAPMPPAAPVLADYSAQLLGLLDALGVERACVVGHSMGALIALDFALAHPERTVAVVAMNAVYCRTAEQAKAVQGRAALLDGEMADPAWRQAALDRWFGLPIPLTQLAQAAWVGAALSAANPVGYPLAYRVFAHSDAAHKGRLPELVMPALFYTGEFDANSSPEMSRLMAAEAPQGEAVILAGEAHMMSLTAPVAVNRELKRFLDGLQR